MLYLIVSCQATPSTWSALSVNQDCVLLYKNEQITAEKFFDSLRVLTFASFRLFILYDNEVKKFATTLGFAILSALRYLHNEC